MEQPPQSSGVGCALLRLIELLSWGVALFFVVPAVPSMEGEVYSPWSSVVAGSIALAVHFGTKVYRGEERLYLAVLKIAMFAGLIWATYKRAFL